MKDIRPDHATIIKTPPSPAVTTATISAVQSASAAKSHQVAALPTIHRLNPMHVHALQRTVGNQAVGQILARRTLQVQRMFTYKGKEYYAGEVTDKTQVYKDLINQPGYFAAAQALASDDSKGPTLKTQPELIAFLKKNYAQVIEAAIQQGGKAEEEFADLLMYLGGEQMQPRGWGHTFSNGKHGDDMWRNRALAQQRAKDERKEAIGVWVDNGNAMRLIATSFARVGGEDSAYFEDLTGMPQDVGVEITQAGEVRPCRGFFIKIKGQIIITAYPTNNTQETDDEDDE